LICACEKKNGLVKVWRYEKRYISSNDIDIDAAYWPRELPATLRSILWKHHRKWEVETNKIWGGIFDPTVNARKNCRDHSICKS
jgi:hypothetical protein